MVDERLNNDMAVDTGDSERAQQEQLVTRTVQAAYESTRAKRIERQSAYTTLLGQYKVLEGQYTTGRNGKKLSMSFQFPNDAEGLENALDNDAELSALKSKLDEEKARLDAAETEYKVEQAVENAYKKEWDGLKEGFKSGKPVEDILNEVERTDENKIREQMLNPEAQEQPQEAPQEQHQEQVVVENPQPVEQNVGGQMPESALPAAEKAKGPDFSQGYVSDVDKDKIKRDNPDASWAKIMERVLSENSIEAAFDSLVVACLTYPLAYAAYKSELALAEKKGKIKHVDEQAAAWNKTMREIKGLSQADVLQAIQGDFLHNPDGLMAKYNKDVYDGLKTDENGRYTGDQAALLSQRIAEKEAKLRETNPDLFEGLKRGEDGRYSKQDAETFRTRYLMHNHPDLLTGIQKDENGQYAQEDIALFNERLLEKNFTTVYEREPTVREKRGMTGGFDNRNQMSLHIRAQEGIYGLALGKEEFAKTEALVPGALTHDMNQAWGRLRDRNAPFKIAPGAGKTYVDVPTFAEKMQEMYDTQQGRQQPEEQVEQPHQEQAEEQQVGPEIQAAPIAPEIHIEPTVNAAQEPVITVTAPAVENTEQAQVVNMPQETENQVVPPTVEVAAPEMPVVPPVSEPQMTVGQNDAPNAKPQYEINRQPTTLDKAQEELNTTITIDAMKVEKNGLDQVIAGIKNKENQVSQDGALLDRLMQPHKDNSAGIGVVRTNDQNTM